MSAQKLYTPELLGLAVELARYSFDEARAIRGEARSQACGSTLLLSFGLDTDQCVEDLGMRVRACAIGQAAAAIFARHAAGRDEANLRRSLSALQSWIEENGELPDWPDLRLIEPARHYPGRHGAIMLPWRAAVAALSSPVASS